LEEKRMLLRNKSAGASRAAKRVQLKLAAALVSNLLAGCTSAADESDYGQILQYARGVFDQKNSDITLEHASAVPYASIGMKIGDGAEQMLILASDEGSDLSWTSAAHISIITRNGRIVRSAGLGQNLNALYSLTSGNLPSPRDALLEPVSEKLIADFKDQQLYSVSIACVAAAAGAERISILGAEIDSVRVEESCNADQIDWSFTNKYWVDPKTGFVWRSEQAIHPHFDPIILETLRPPESDG
jgi:hypothetical protein